MSSVNKTVMRAVDIGRFRAVSDRTASSITSQQYAAIAESHNFRPLLDALNQPVFVLNQYRQIVFANEAGLQHLYCQDIKHILGLRLGEALNCIHAKATEAGCGHTEFCESCGAIDAILHSQQNVVATRECRIQRNVDGDLDLLIKATPFNVAEHQLTVMAVTDISDRKRRRSLERIFFHDILNTAASIRLAARSLQNEGPRITLLQQAAEQLLDEIKSQKILLDAENRELSTSITILDSLELIRSSINTMRCCQGNEDRLQIAPEAQSLQFKSDHTLLRRVLANAVQNALEASSSNQIVTVGCRAVGKCIEFWVHNPVHIPRNIQLQIFQRSFSTKADDRGFGTYSMKLLSERYLNGQVHFESSKASGTRFTMCYPLQLQG